MPEKLLTLEMTFADGDGHVTVARDDPLVAVFRRAAETGKYTGDWMFLAVRPDPESKPRLLGTVAWTPRGRFLYFPGQRGEVHSTHTDKSLNSRKLDHVTLELDEAMSSFNEHVAVLSETSKGSRGQARRGPVHRNHLHPWFSLLLKNLDAYPKLPALFSFEFPIPESDIERRTRAMMGRGQRTATTFPVPGGEGPHYYQLDVWAGRGTGWQERFANMVAWAAVEEIVEHHRGEPITRKAQIQRLSEDSGIITILTRPSGVLRKAGLIHPVIQPVAAASEGR